jgi:hypothetical protein
MLPLYLIESQNFPYLVQKNFANVLWVAFSIPSLAAPGVTLPFPSSFSLVLQLEHKRFPTGPGFCKDPGVCVHIISDSLLT